MEYCIHFTAKNRPTLTSLLKVFKDVNDRRFGGHFDISRSRGANMIQVRYIDIIPGTMLHKYISVNEMFFMTARTIDLHVSTLTGWHEYVDLVFLHEIAKDLNGKIADHRGSVAADRALPTPELFTTFPNWLAGGHVRWTTAEMRHLPPNFQGF